MTRRGSAPPRRRSPWLALESGADPVERARELREAHASHVGAGAVGEAPPVVRGLIADSWRRSAGAGVRPEGHVPPRVRSEDEVHEMREEHPLARMMPTLRHLLRDGLDDDFCAVVGLAMRDAGCNPRATFDARGRLP